MLIIVDQFCIVSRPFLLDWRSRPRPTHPRRRPPATMPIQWQFFRREWTPSSRCNQCTSESELITRFKNLTRSLQKIWSSNIFQPICRQVHQYDDLDAVLPYLPEATERA
jgi:hypothetical protein